MIGNCCEWLDKDDTGSERPGKDLEVIVRFERMKLAMFEQNVRK